MSEFTVVRQRFAKRWSSRSLKAARLRAKKWQGRYNGLRGLAGTCMRPMGKPIVAAALIGIMAVAAVTPSQARWYRHHWSPSVVPPGGVIGWSVPFSFNYVGPSYFSNAPVYVLPNTYSPEVRRYVRRPRYYW